MTDEALLFGRVTFGKWQRAFAVTGGANQLNLGPALAAPESIVAWPVPLVQGDVLPLVIADAGCQYREQYKYSRNGYVIAST